MLPADVEDACEAVRTSLRLLDCAPLEVTAPLLASVYLAPVATILNPDVTVWLHGASGSMKSTIRALAHSSRRPKNPSSVPARPTAGGRYQ